MPGHHRQPNNPGPRTFKVRMVNGLVVVEGASQRIVEEALKHYFTYLHGQSHARQTVETPTDAAIDEEPELAESNRRELEIDDTHLRLLMIENFHTFQTLAELRGVSVQTVRRTVAKSVKSKELFIVDSGNRKVIPAVQLSAEGKADGRIVEVVQPLLSVGLEGWGIWAWLTTPDGRLDGDIPAELVRDNPTWVYDAACRLADDIRRNRGEWV